MQESQLLPLIRQLKAECMRAVAGDDISCGVLSGSSRDNADKNSTLTAATQPLSSSSSSFSSSSSLPSSSLPVKQTNASNVVVGLSGRRGCQTQSLSPMPVDRQLSSHQSVYQYLTDYQNRRQQQQQRRSQQTDQTQLDCSTPTTSVRQLERRYRLRDPDIDNPFNRSVGDRLFGKDLSDTESSEIPDSASCCQTSTSNDNDVSECYRLRDSEKAAGVVGGDVDRKRLIDRVQQLDSWVWHMKRRLNLDVNHAGCELDSTMPEAKKERRRGGEKMAAAVAADDDEMKTATNNSMKHSAPNSSVDSTLDGSLKGRQQSDRTSDSQYYKRSSSAIRYANANASSANDRRQQQQQQQQQQKTLQATSNSTPIQEADAKARRTSSTSSDTVEEGDTGSVSDVTVTSSRMAVTEVETSTPLFNYSSTPTKHRDGEFDLGDETTKTPTSSTMRRGAEADTKTSTTTTEMSTTAMTTTTATTSTTSKSGSSGSAKQPEAKEGEEEKEKEEREEQEQEEKEQNAEMEVEMDEGGEESEESKREEAESNFQSGQRRQVSGRQAEKYLYALQHEKRLRKRLNQQLRSLRNPERLAKPTIEQVRQAVSRHVKDVYQIGLRFDPANARFLPLMLYVKKWPWNSRQYAAFANKQTELNQRYHAVMLHKWTHCIRVDACKSVSLQQSIDAVSSRIGLVRNEAQLFRIAFPDDVEFGRDSIPLNASQTPTELGLEAWEELFVMADIPKPDRPPRLIDLIEPTYAEQKRNNLVDNSNAKENDCQLLSLENNENHSDSENMQELQQQQRSVTPTTDESSGTEQSEFQQENANVSNCTVADKLPIAGRVCQAAYRLRRQLRLRRLRARDNCQNYSQSTEANETRTSTDESVYKTTAVDDDNTDSRLSRSGVAGDSVSESAEYWLSG